MEKWRAWSNAQLIVWLVCWCLTALSAQIGYIMPQAYEIYIVLGRGKTHSNINKPNERKNINTLFHLGIVEKISSPQKGVIQRSLSNQSLGKY